MPTDDQNRKVAATHWPKCAASIAVFKGNSVLLVERAKPPRAGLWSLPGGHIEPGEGAATAASRELAEETGVVAELVGLVDILDVITRDDAGALTAHFLLAVFCGHWLSGEPVAASDSRAAEFVALDRLAAYRLTPGAEAIIRQASVRVGQPTAIKLPEP
jgi:8-oxo-dGTP diphosphatase